MKTKIYYHDTDCGGVVYYGRYLEFLEEARTEYFNEHGLQIKDLVERGINFVVSHVELKYKYPARYADILEVNASVKSFTKTSLEFLQEAVNQEHKLIVGGTVRLVCVDKNLRPQALPEDIKDKLKLDG